MPKKIEFTVPEGYAFPEGVKQGDEFKELVTFEYKGDRKVCVKEVNEQSMPGYNDSDEEVPVKQDYRSQVEDRAQTMMGPQ